jgi:hypothetical protein
MSYQRKTITRRPHSPLSITRPNGSHDHKLGISCLVTFSQSLMTRMKHASCPALERTEMHKRRVARSRLRATDPCCIPLSISFLTLGCDIHGRTNSISTYMLTRTEPASIFLLVSQGRDPVKNSPVRNSRKAKGHFRIAGHEFNDNVFIYHHPDRQHVHRRNCSARY